MKNKIMVPYGESLIKTSWPSTPFSLKLISLLRERNIPLSCQLVNVETNKNSYYHELYFTQFYGLNDTFRHELYRKNVLNLDQGKFSGDVAVEIGMGAFMGDFDHWPAEDTTWCSVNNQKVVPYINLDNSLKNASPCNLPESVKIILKKLPGISFEIQRADLDSFESFYLCITGLQERTEWLDKLEKKIGKIREEKWSDESSPTFELYEEDDGCDSNEAIKIVRAILDLS